MMPKHKSRRQRLEDIIGNVEQAKGEVEELQGEIDNWIDSMPENLHGSEKADRLSECLENLQTIMDALQEAIDVEVEFPGMMG